MAASHGAAPAHGAPETHAPAGGHDEHGHGDHAHDPAADARVVASVVIVLAVGAALAVGLVAPQTRRAQPAAADEGPHGEAAHRAREGIVVLQDGEVIVGRISEDADGTVHIHIEAHDGHEGGERVVPARRIRWKKIGRTTLHDDEDYWLRHGSERLDERYAREVGGGGIVVLKNGQVLVGRLAVGERSITVRWPYKDQPQQGEVTVPRADVRWHDAKNDELTDDYWRQFPDLPVDQRRPGKAAGGDGQRGAAGERPAAPPQHGARDPERSEATLAKLEGQWELALRLWVVVYRKTGLSSDLAEVRNVATTLRDGARLREIPGNVEAIHRELSPLVEAPGIRDQLALAYELGVACHVAKRDLEPARRWLRELKGLGPQYARRVAISEEAIEHLEKPEDEHEHGKH